MAISGEGRFEEVARKARRVQDAVAEVRGRAALNGVRIEVEADGRIVGLELPDAALAQVISRAHELALARARERAAELRAELTADPMVAGVLRRLTRALPDLANSPGPQAFPPDGVDEGANGYALPAAIRRRYGLG
ncbi:hypothetical protein [Nocardia seriolae]|uniref:YbaB/EbfC family DNA-binding protein n=1 Tax=Nocardia seriolae TaxID=37332 RepID=A0ABC8AMA9_9NOCA|nr:hypothetical protein [Nocardia seriolae]APA95355.1 hypothetical protein NS506_01282 [Nocardia seriolae]MTJ66500.1 hypothetical protein [Nocardia seriolae]MTJ70593.1 hypothetical protein [Nocardia seriolae]MTJ85603.1 hypothetical protein [Nocardia seriolae]MTK29600.1 hypothetical protein [Nocardia seriolae]